MLGRQRTFLLAALPLIATAAPALAQSTYERHVIFDNARADGWWYYSGGEVIAPSALELIKNKLPIEKTRTRSAPNSLKLAWTSKNGGNWRVTIDAARESGRRGFEGDSLSFWVYPEQIIDASNTPRIMVVDAKGAVTPTIDLIGTLRSLPARQWTRVVLPFKSFKGLFRWTEDVTMDPRMLAQIVIVQGLDDARPNTLYLDDIRVADAAGADTVAPPAPAALTAKGYDRHVDLTWSPGVARDVESIRIYRSLDERPFALVGIQKGHLTRYADFLGASGKRARYRISAVDVSGNESTLSATAAAATRVLTDDELLTMVQEAQFRYYWEGAHPRAGMAIEITPGDPDQVALGASGFGIMALVAGVDRGFVTREQGLQRMLKIARFLKTADRFHGVWPHFLNGNTGKTMPYFGKYDDGADLIETAFLIQGLLTARQYFNGDSAGERELRETITRFWREVEWDWYRQGDSPQLYWHWSANHGFYIGHPLIGWNEALIAYLLAIASPTHPVPASLWHTGWAGQSDLAVAYRRNWSRTTEGDHFTNGNSYYGIKLEVGEGNGAELFFTQFSFLGFDPRGIRDRYTNYFKNNRNIALISQAYAIDNPRRYTGYGAEGWGQSAGVHTRGGRARPADDNGTLVVHAALGSMPYTPAESMKALKHYYRDLGDRTWGIYGFVDAFNQTENWHDEVYMGLNQAQTVAMIENHRSGLLWKLFMSNPEIAPALDKIGFELDR